MGAFCLSTDPAHNHFLYELWRTAFTQPGAQSEAPPPLPGLQTLLQQVHGRPCLATGS